MKAAEEAKEVTHSVNQTEKYEEEGIMINTNVLDPGNADTIAQHFDVIRGKPVIIYWHNKSRILPLAPP